MQCRCLDVVRSPADSAAQLQDAKHLSQLSGTQAQPATGVQASVPHDGGQQKVQCTSGTYEMQHRELLAQGPDFMHCSAEMTHHHKHCHMMCLPDLTCSIDFRYPPCNGSADVLLLQSSVGGKFENKKKTLANAAKAKGHPSLGVMTRSRTAEQEGKAAQR